MEEGAVMAGPWEDYAPAAAQEGPWSDYAATSAPAAEPLLTREQSLARFDKVEEPGFVDKAALAADKVLTSLGSAVPDWMPSRQDVVDVAAGASEMGGLLRNAPRLQNVATESGWRTAGRVLDPTAAMVGLRAFQAVPQVASRVGTLMPRIQPVLDTLTKSGLAQNVTGGAAAGGAVGLMGGIGEGKPIEGALEGAAMGGAFGAAFSPLAWLGEKAIALGANLKAGAEGQVVRYLDEVFKGDRAMVADTLRQLKGLVAGETPTTGLGAVSGRTPITGLKALEEQARSRSPQLFAGVDQANQAARAAPLEAMAAPGQRFFDPDTGKVVLSELEALRKQVTDPLYAIANKDRVALTQQLDDMIAAAQVSPLAAKGEASYQQMLANRGAAPAEAATYTPKGPDVLGMVPETPFMPVSPTRSIQELQRVKDELSKRINDLSSAADAPSVNLRNQLDDARRQLTEAMKTQSGAYALANDIFRNYSAGQNQADVAQVLLNALKSPAGKEREAAFLSAMRDAPGTIKKSGAPRFQDLREIMSRDQMREVINPIEASVRREAAYANLPAPTSSLPPMRSTMEEIQEATPAVLKTAVSVMRRLFARAGAETTAEAKTILDRAAVDPKFMAQLLEQSLPKDRAKIANAVMAQMKQTRGAIVGETVEQQ